MYFNKFILKRNQVCALKIWNANQINFQMKGDINVKNNYNNKHNKTVNSAKGWKKCGKRVRNMRNIKQFQFCIIQTKQNYIKHNF